MGEQIDRADIDEELKDLVKGLNDAGIVTEFSCSGHGEQPAYMVMTLGAFTAVEITNDRYGQRLILRWRMEELVSRGKFQGRKK